MLVAGMHLTLATHYCGGKIAATQLSFSGKLATCGMPMDEHRTTTGDAFTINCCKDEITVYLLDDNCFQPFFKIKTLPLTGINAFLAITSTLPQEKILPDRIATNTGPPGHTPDSATSRAMLCLLRI